MTVRRAYLLNKSADFADPLFFLHITLCFSSDSAIIRLVYRDKRRISCV